MTTAPAPDSKAPRDGGPSAMTPYAIAVALFAAFVAGGVLAKSVPLWAVVLGPFVFTDRYPRLPRRGWTRRS
jgi:hypothetical protein